MSTFKPHMPLLGIPETEDSQVFTRTAFSTVCSNSARKDFCMRYAFKSDTFYRTPVFYRRVNASPTYVYGIAYTTL